MDDVMTFGGWLRQRRKAFDLTKQALAQRVGCSAAMITKIESGVRRPSQQIAERLAAALDIGARERDAFIHLARRMPTELPTLPAAPLPSTVTSSASATLPTPITPLIGREQDVQTVIKHIQRVDVRLVTLIGPPGVGKTRLSLEVAQRVRAAFSDGALFVPLAAVREPAHVLNAIALSLEVQEQTHVSALDRLVLALRPRRLLLVLDNFEQVMAAAPQIAQLLSACPTLTVLATSRERLWVRGEHQMRVLPLSLPKLGQTDPAMITQSPAVQLFVDVAQAANADFQFTPENAGTVATICIRLDGLPLAIELAAVHSDRLPPAALLARIEQRLLLADEGPRDLPDRQRTLRATLDWSYALLSQAEQSLLNRLGVFVGAWSLEAVKHVCNTEAMQHGDSSLPAQLTALISKSLVQQQTHPSGETSFTLLETIHVYALERLRGNSDAERTYARHADYYCTLAERASIKLKGSEQHIWIEHLRRARDDLRAAFRWLISKGQVEQAGRLCGALRHFWWMTGGWSEGRTWIAQVLDGRTALTPLTLAYVYIADGMLASGQGNGSEAVAAFEAALMLAHDQEDEECIGIATHNLGNVLLSHGDYARGRTLLEAGLIIDRASGDRWGLAISLGSLGELCYILADYQAAQAYYRESLAIFQEQGDHNSVALTLNNLGEIARRQGDFDTAQAHLVEGLVIARTHDLRRLLPHLLNNLSMTAFLQQQPTPARRFLHEALDVLRETGSTQVLDASLTAAALLALNESQPAIAISLLSAAQALRTTHTARLSPHEQAEFEAQVARAQAVLNQATFDAAWAAGQQIAIAEAIKLAQEV